MNASEPVKDSDIASAVAIKSEAKRVFPKTHANYWKGP